MPFLKASLIPHKKSEKKREKPKKVIRTLEDVLVAKAVKTLLQIDDLTTKREMALLGL